MAHGRAVARELSLLLALLAVALGSLVAAPPSRAEAQGKARYYGRTHPLLPVRLDAHAAMSWDGALGLGGRVDIPVATAAGLRYSPRDELSLSLGGDVTFISFDGSLAVEVYPTLMFQWSLGVSDRFFFYPEVGLVSRIDRHGWDGVSPNLGFGARYYLGRSFGLFGRFGWPFAISAGTMF
jgi:hypothetical protein